MSGTAQYLHLNCTATDIRIALAQCPNTAASPDGVSFAMLKAVSDVIMLSLLIIFQQSLSQGEFPSSWKKAKVFPVYNGIGERSLPFAYRPMSLCSCVGKLFEKVVAVQLVEHICAVKPLSICQFGFQRGRSTIANLLVCEAFLSKYLNERKSFDIFSFDFQRAFDKVPHDLLLEALDSLGLHATNSGLVQ
jgi:hypothetical protein